MLSIKASEIRHASVLALVAFAAAALADSPLPSREDAIGDHARSLEASGQGEFEDMLAVFEKRRFSARYLESTSRDERRRMLATIAEAAASAGGAMLDLDGDDVRLSLLGPAPIAVVFRVEAAPPFAIDTLRIEDVANELPRVELTWKNAAATFRKLQAEGFSGVVYLAQNGRTVLEKAYGSSNESLGFRTRLDTIYGIGSMPIDFTVAALFLLARDGELEMDDPISQYFAGVPDDKRLMTLANLVSGRSGLADFHDRPGDWDADLGWIDREEAIARILARPLLFAPGQGEAHSHSAYVLAAAVIEMVSNKPYFDFLRENIFEPAGMTRTGMYGDRRHFGIRDFAEGRGASAVGLPNIPPNWGPTSWLVMGSGGMYSTLGDLQRFYAFVRADATFEPEYARRWSGDLVGAGGSDRGFFVYHVAKGDEAEAMMLINGEGRSPGIRALSRGLETLVMGD